jgi:RNA polymerase sigma factor (sigma-70 family)
MTPEQLFLTHLHLIKKVVAHTCRCCNLQKEEAEEFLSEVHDKIMADDYAVLRKFEGKSSLKSYLAVVIKNQMRDFQNHLWGKWRYTEMAKRLGPVAMALEKLIRDGYTFDEVVAILQTNHKVEMSPLEFHEIAAKLPPRIPRHREGEEILELLPSTEDQPDAPMRRQEKNSRKAMALEALQNTLKSLPAEDQIILRMKYWNHFSVKNTAKALNLDDKPLYKRIQKTLKHLKSEMERQGIRKEDIEDLFDDE